MSAPSVYCEPAREVPVSHSVDVVVAGGGTAGVAAAVCAARMGLRVVMVERTSIPGGMVTHVTQWLNDFENKGGFAAEFLAAITEGGICSWPYYSACRVVPYFDELLADAGVTVLYLAAVAAPMLEGARVRGVIVESKSGRHAIEAACTVDATGDGDVAARAGAPFRVGRSADGACQAISLSHLITNYRGPDLDGKVFLQIVADAAAQAGQGYTLPYDHIGRFRKLPGSRHMVLNGTPHVTGFDAMDAEELSAALVALRRQAVEYFDTLKHHSEAFADIEFGPFSGIPGIRESRRIVGDADISYADTVTGARCADGLFLVTQAIDIHKCTPDEPSIYVEKVKPYHVPYGALLPRNIEGVLVAGRCISGDHEALASYRIIADCYAMGEAAAIACRLAVDAGVTPRNVDGVDVAAEMRSRGYRQ